MAQSITLSSAGFSAALALNPVSKSTTLQLTVSSSAVSTFDLWLSLDDPSTTPAPTMSWSLLSSAAAITSSNNLFGIGYVLTVLSPVGAVRIGSSTNAAPTVYTLKALQSVTA